MKLQFDDSLEHQQRAVTAITDIFTGQETDQNIFTPRPAFQTPATTGENLQTQGNQLQLDPQELLINIRAIQLRNGLAPSTTLDSMHFTIEMETGTGKTYVYLRTMFELHKRYGFNAFIVVVPSVAIKEGVHTTLHITREHFKALYDNVAYDFFVYDPQNLEQVRNFADSNTMQIMVINIDAFRKSFTDPEKEHKANIIHRSHDRLDGQRPITFLQAAHPIVIIDEPQSVDTTPKAKEAIQALNPLAILRYSATHREKHHLMYRLDPAEAYAQKLVKQIEVASVAMEEHHNSPYIALLHTDHQQSPITARIALHIQQKHTIARKEITVRQGSDLFTLSNGRTVYKDMKIEHIHAQPGKEHIILTGREEPLQLGESTGEMNDDLVKRLQIRTTIEHHLNKELQLTAKGIKVLSLFFIDTVAHYRSYDGQGKPVLGKYARWFEEEFSRLAQESRYRFLFQNGSALFQENSSAISEIHGGYFAQDRQHEGRKSTEINTETRREELTYNLIMRDKERLLSLDCKLRFLFSHSALKEGWDNPNVFQICTLKDAPNSVIRRRQEIGRGLRLCVDQNGARVHGFHINTLTIIAGESYEAFAKGLQQELQEETGGEQTAATHPLKNAQQRQQLAVNGRVYHSAEFQELWQRIQGKTHYRVHFDTANLIAECSREIAETLRVTKARLVQHTAQVAITGQKITITQNQSRTYQHSFLELPLPDPLAHLQNATGLTRKTLAAILIASGKMQRFHDNPQAFLEQASRILQKTLDRLMVEGVEYKKANPEKSTQEHPVNQNLYGYRDENLIKSKKSIYHHVLYNNDREKAQVETLEREAKVRLFFKLPENFQIPTPLGPYHPDWAGISENSKGKRHFWIMTQTPLGSEHLSLKEKAMHQCAKSHLQALATGVDFFVLGEGESWEKVMGG